MTDGWYTEPEPYEVFGEPAPYADSSTSRDSESSGRKPYGQEISGPNGASWRPVPEPPGASCGSFLAPGPKRDWLPMDPSEWGRCGDGQLPSS